MAKTPISYKEELKRKAVHMSSLWMVALTLIMPHAVPGYGRWISCAVFAAALLLTLVSEHAYAKGDGNALGKLYGIIFGQMLRDEVKPGQWIISGATPVLVAALAANLFFVPVIAASALAIMLTGDTAAALVGRKLGKHKLVNGKSLEGTAAFVVAALAASFAVCAICAAPDKFYIAAALAVLAAAVTELFTEQLKTDDNLSITVVSAVVMFLVTRF